MRRTEVLDGVRMLKFRDVFGRCEQGRLSKLEAAELLGINERTFRRWCRRYEEEGEAGLLDRRLGKPSARRVPAGEVEEVERLYRERYEGFMPSTSTSTWCSPTASAGATAGPRLIFRTAATFRRRLGVEHTGASGRASRCPE